MAKFVKSFFTRHPLAANSIIYGSLYVGAELSQQVVTKKYLVSAAQEDDTRDNAIYLGCGVVVGRWRLCSGGLEGARKTTIKSFMCVICCLRAAQNSWTHRCGSTWSIRRHGHICLLADSVQLVRIWYLRYFWGAWRWHVIHKNITQYHTI